MAFKIEGFVQPKSSYTLSLFYHYNFTFGLVSFICVFLKLFSVFIPIFHQRGEFYPSSQRSDSRKRTVDDSVPNRR